MLDKGLEGFREALLAELEIARKQLLGLAENIPPDKFAWRPDSRARSVGEVFVHISVGCYFLLDVAGHPFPADIYASIAGNGEERLWKVVNHNDQLEKTRSAKESVLPLLNRALSAVCDSILKSDEGLLTQPVPRRVYLRL